MKLTLKLVAAQIALIVMILAADSYLSVQRESEFLRRELQRKAYRIGSAMKKLVADAWQREGPDYALSLVAAANQRDEIVIIRWVWLDAASGDQFHPQVPVERLQPVTLGQSLTLQHRTSDGTEYLFSYVAVPVDQRHGALELSEPLSIVDDFARKSVHRNLVLGTIIVTGSIAVSALMGVLIVGWPLKRLIDKARRVGLGDLSGAVQLDGRAELSELAETVNEMCEHLAESQERVRQEAETRIAAIEQLRHADRLRTVGQLASGVAHELGTPLNVVTGRASLIGSGKLTPEAVTESAGIIKSQAERMAVIIRQLLDFSRHGVLHRAQTNLSMIVRQTLQVLEPLSRKQGVELLVTSTPEPLSACVDAGQLQQVLTNLVVNAVQATPAGGRITIGITREHIQPPPDHGDSVDEFFCFSVEDTGHGIPEDVLARLFEPFVTTKDVGQGTGLGLSIAYGIIEEHGGWIDVQSEVGRGTRFCVYLPTKEQPCPAES